MAQRIAATSTCTPPRVAVVVVLIGTLVRFATFFPWTPESLVVDEPPVAADAVVVLEGDLGRIPRAVALVSAGYASTIIYPGLAPVAEPYLERAIAAASAPLELIVPANTATESTWEEAIRTRQILTSRPEITSVLLVTSEYHSRRARWAFAAALPRSVSITTVAVQRPSWSPGAAREPGPARDLFRSEQLKSAGYFLLYGALALWPWTWSYIPDEIESNGVSRYPMMKAHE